MAGGALPLVGAPRLTILILGGYGTFGGRLARLLADEARLTLIIAGRSLERAERFCATFEGAATAVPARLDRSALAELPALRPDLVVDASGPFQLYGPKPYAAVIACLAAGIPYVDLADGREFVAGIAPYDRAARQRGVFVLAGASSFPVLTVAVVRALSTGLASVESVTGGIAPSPYAGVGANVVRAIAAYAGQPIPLRRDGADAVGYGLAESRDYTIAPPGQLPLRTTRFSLVDVPDLALLPELWPGLRSVWMGAGPVPEILHRALNGLAALVRRGVLPNLTRLAPLFERAVNTLRWGEDRGGMFVEVAGRDHRDRPVTRSWHLVAEGADGPLIPSMAVEAIVRGMLEGRRPEPGARAAAGELTLADYECMFTPRRIRTGRREHARPDAPPVPLYRALLGEAWAELPAPVRALHDSLVDRSWSGFATVERGRGFLARLGASAVGFPAAGWGRPVRVRFTVRDGEETWERDFSGRCFSSVQSAGRGRWEHLLVERFGPLAVALALVVEPGRLRLVVRRWSLFGIAMPRRFAPQCDAFEAVDDGRFRFSVAISHPLTGPIVGYRGSLEPDEVPASAEARQAETTV